MQTREKKDDSRYEQFELSPEMIEEELRPAVCKQRQTDLRRIDMNYVVPAG